ncbi:GNAT family N-acetyltransferase, partial [Actinoplanes sp. NPDC048791]|uniref:GNAT family N-acetyltransferase n=1 Tax=Actinoplanes sp. NPDC048791 TaxID=3154623 RepID=UPI0033FE8C44
MIDLSRGLSPAALSAIEDLERRVVAADGGRLKLEWNALRHRYGQDVEDVLWWDGERLLGFLGLYAHSAPTVELAGMVDPAARRHGIGTALLDAALVLGR